jgi:hypothetical protein
MNIASIVLLNPLIAQSAGTTNSASWALVLFCVILGLLVALNPARRTSEIKRTKE